METRHGGLLSRCLAVDLEVDPSTARVFAIAAVCHDDRPAINTRGMPTARQLDELEAAVRDVKHPIGHNFLQHDMEHLIAVRPRFAGLMEAPIDTLWLNPLAFPRNPYHHLVKHYQDGRLAKGHVNDPELDARLVFEVLANQLDAFSALGARHPEALAAFHYLTTRLDRSKGFDAVFNYLRSEACPSQPEAFSAIRGMLLGKACRIRIEQTLGRLANPRNGWAMAYALSWISVAGGDSVMPPWVRAQFREASLIVRHLRDTSCRDPACIWCVEQNDPVRALKRWFGFDGFRPDPVDPDGRSLQERIVDEGMSGTSVLGILPTGTGKSLCYQVPALSRYDKTGALTVVISPLVALMADQVDGMTRAGISCSVTINGMMSMPERQDALDKVRMGDAGILIISPEQLRSNSIRSVLAQREVGLWVIDEAHCVSKWGHDFRPDYRYLGRFIREHSGDQPPAPITCLTATAKPEVVADIVEHFRSRTGVELLTLDGGASRPNLTFMVRPTTKAEKLSHVLAALNEFLPVEGRSGAVVYCASRKETHRVADFLAEKGIDSAAFHAKLGADEKKEVQERFRIGELRVIAATNAFGMGIDKPDIRLVVHADIPGSLENYLQEAGRAGRDRKDAHCVLLYAADDIENQFRLSANSRLQRHEIGAILKAIRRIDERTKKTGTIVATTGEIVRSEKDLEFERDSATDDTRVKTAVSWLEEATLVSREENRVRVFPSSLRTRTLDEARERLTVAAITDNYRKQLLDIIAYLMSSPADEGVSTDDLSAVCGLAPGALSKAMADLETLGLARNDVAMTVFIHVGVAHASAARLAAAAQLEVDLIQLLQELAPEVDDGTPTPLHLAETCQRLRDNGHLETRPDIVDKLLRSIARDGRGQDIGKGNISLRTASRNTLLVRLERPWRTIAQTAELRRTAAGLLLAHLTGRLDKGARGKDLQVDTTVGDLLAQLTQDAFLKRSGIRDMTRLLERSLLWLHEQEIATLGKGLTVFRPAMTICLNPRGGTFSQSDFAPLEEHYAEQTLQTHVMATYAETGLVSMVDAMRLSEDYFLLNKDQFLKRWMPGKAREVRRQTTGKSWKAIVEDLGNKAQQDIVTDDRDRTNVLILAGPGSGKTRVLVHRIAYLLRIKREDPRGILVLAYNRHAAAEIRARLRALVGDDTVGVTISTCHALAMRLVGASFAGTQAASEDFDTVVMEAVRLLSAEGLTKAEAEAQRESLIQGFRWILVDEYQDIGPQEYALIAAVAGRTLEDTELKLSLFAVGDDDQNIYAFNGASVEYIRRFEEDYKARPAFLVENYRATACIIEASNHVIAGAPGRMKLDHPIRINQDRAGLPAGGRMAQADPVAKGRVQLLDVPSGDMAQAAAAIDELTRLSRLDPNWNWSRTAVISRTWHALNAVRAYAEVQGIRAEMANEDMPNIWRLRETQRFVAGLREKKGALLGIQDILEVLNQQLFNKWVGILAEGIADLARELRTGTMPVPDIVEWIAEWARDTRGQQNGLLLLTAHRAKGLEFDHVVILNGDWRNPSRTEDADAPRRLFYVAMTRARESLTVLTSGPHHLLDAGTPSLLQRRVDSDTFMSLPPADIYMLPNLRLVDLSFAGRLRSDNEGLQAIRDAQVGDHLTLVERDGKWELLDALGRLLGRMKKEWSPPPGHVFDGGRVGAIVNWRKVDNKEEFHGSLRRENWETVLPEMVFRPLDQTTCQELPGLGTVARGVTPHLLDKELVPPFDIDDEPAGKIAENLTEVEKSFREAQCGADGWGTLMAALQTRGLALLPRGGGLVIADAKTGSAICKLSKIGFRYIGLIQRFGEGFPGHPATWLVERALTGGHEAKAPKQSRRSRKQRNSSTAGDDLTLIEE